MRVLLDTHVWLWMWSQPQALRNETRALLEDPTTEVCVSAVSAWEISTKEAAGRLRLPTAAASWLADPRHRDDVVELPITFEHAIRAGELPPHHRDPWDRMLVAQAQAEAIPLVTADQSIVAYEVEVLRA